MLKHCEKENLKLGSMWRDKEIECVELEERIEELTNELKLRTAEKEGLRKKWFENIEKRCEYVMMRREEGFEKQKGRM